MPNEKVGGEVVITGVAVDPILDDTIGFSCYTVWCTKGAAAMPADPMNPGSEWHAIETSARSILNSTLAYWDTEFLSSGTYTILLVAQDKNTPTANYSAAIVTVEIGN